MRFLKKIMFKIKFGAVHKTGELPIVYRLICVTVIGIFSIIPSYIEIKILALLSYFGTLGS